MLAYSWQRWDALMRSDTRMATTLRRETLWLIGGEPDPPS
ncbi:hypothetical protein BH23DEI1_BH23DEI1_13470 [soil metagenome]